MDRRHFLGLGLATVGAALLPRQGWSAPAREGVWTSVALEPRRRFAVGAVGSRVLVAGGQRWDNQASKSVASDRIDIYDAATRTWSSTKLAQPRVYARAVAVGRRLLIVGWRDDRGIVESAEVYDSESEGWSLQPLHFGKDGFTTATVGDRVLIRSRLPDGGSVLHTYDAAADTWTSEQSSTPVRGLSPIVVGRKVVYGRINDGGELDFWHGLDVYDAETGAWSTASLPTPRIGVTATSIGPLVMFAGGVRDREVVDVVEIYDTRTGAWTTSRLSAARGKPPACLVGDRLLFFSGTGTRPDGSPLDASDSPPVVDIFDAASGSWTTGRLSAPSGRVTTVVVGNQAFFASSRTNVDIYDAASDRWSTTHLSVAREAYAVASVGSHVVFAGGSTPSRHKSVRNHVDAVDAYDTTSGTWTTGRLQKGRETTEVAVVGSQLLFVGGIFGCQGCGPSDADPLVDIFDASLA